MLLEGSLVPFFIARASQTSRTVVVGHTAYPSRDAAMLAARTRYPAESCLIIEAETPADAALEANKANTLRAREEQVLDPLGLEVPLPEFPRRTFVSPAGFLSVTRWAAVRLTKQKQRKDEELPPSNGFWNWSSAAGRDMLLYLQARLEVIKSHLPKREAPKEVPAEIANHPTDSESGAVQASEKSPRRPWWHILVVMVAVMSLLYIRE